MEVGLWLCGGRGKSNCPCIIMCDSVAWESKGKKKTYLLHLLPRTKEGLSFLFFSAGNCKHVPEWTQVQ